MKCKVTKRCLKLQPSMPETLLIIILNYLSDDTHVHQLCAFRMKFYYNSSLHKPTVTFFIREPRKILQCEQG